MKIKLDKNVIELKLQRGKIITRKYSRRFKNGCRVFVTAFSQTLKDQSTISTSMSAGLLTVVVGQKSWKRGIRDAVGIGVLIGTISGVVNVVSNWDYIKDFKGGKA